MPVLEKNGRADQRSRNPRLSILLLNAFDPLVKQRVGHFSCKLLENQDPFGPDELAIATRMKNLAQQDAERFGDINKRIIDGVDLEHAFNELARIVIHRELPYNDASVFEQSLYAAAKKIPLLPAVEPIQDL